MTTYDLRNYFDFSMDVTQDMQRYLAHYITPDNQNDVFSYLDFLTQPRRDRTFGFTIELPKLTVYLFTKYMVENHLSYTDAVAYFNGVSRTVNCFDTKVVETVFNRGLLGHPVLTSEFYVNSTSQDAILSIIGQGEVTENIWTDPRFVTLSDKEFKNLQAYCQTLSPLTNSEYTAEDALEFFAKIDRRHHRDAERLLEYGIAKETLVHYTNLSALFKVTISLANILEIAPLDIIRYVYPTYTYANLTGQDIRTQLVARTLHVYSSNGEYEIHDFTSRIRFRVFENHIDNAPLLNQTLTDIFYDLATQTIGVELAHQFLSVIGEGTTPLDTYIDALSWVACYPYDVREWLENRPNSASLVNFLIKNRNQLKQCTSDFRNTNIYFQTINRINYLDFR